MRRYEDNHFDLGIVDPPYGIGKDWEKRNKGHKHINTSYSNQTIPDKAYFDELFRVSKEQIIWGYNYYVEYLGATNYLIVWDKCSNNNQVFKYSKAELAYTSKRIPLNLVKVPWDGYRMGKETGKKKIHPHQKPIELYEWLLTNYAKKGDLILDTHVGSASSLISYDRLGFNVVGCEIDTELFNLSKARVKEYCIKEGKYYGE